MARITGCVALPILLFLLFTVSRAREIHDPLPEPKTESENTKQINHEPHHQHNTVSFTVQKSHPVPLTYVTFRPINLTPINLLYPRSLRLGNHRSRPRLRLHRRKIPYGNDMIVRSDAAAVDPAIRGTVRRIPSHLPRFPLGRIGLQIYPKYHEKEHEEAWFWNKLRKFLNMFRF